MAKAPHMSGGHERGSQTGVQRRAGRSPGQPVRHIESLCVTTRAEVEKLRAKLDHRLVLRADVQRDLATHEANVAQTIMRYQVGGVISLGVLPAVFRVIG
jgi:hypothetical protein